MAYVDLILRDRPVAYWKCDESSGNIVDSTGNGHTGVATGPPTIASVSAAGEAIEHSAIHFSNANTGSYQIATSTDFQAPNNCFSLECWVKPDSVPGLQGVINSDNGSGTGRFFQFRFESTGTLTIILFQAGSAFTFSTTTKISAAAHHLVMSYNGSEGGLWIDGYLDTPFFKALTLPTGTHALAIGNEIAGISSAPMNGCGINDVAFYQYALSASQIQAHYRAGYNRLPLTGFESFAFYLSSIPATPVSDSDSAALSSAVITAGPSTDKSDTDHVFTADAQTVAPSVSATDTLSVAAGAPSIGVSSADTETFAETSISALAGGPNAADAQLISAADAVNTLTANVSASDSANVAEIPPEVRVKNPDVIVDTDGAALSEQQTNSSGGIDSSFYGVVIAFGNDGLDGEGVAWTRLDDPKGTT